MANRHIAKRIRRVVHIDRTTDDTLRQTAADLSMTEAAVARAWMEAGADGGGMSLASKIRATISDHEAGAGGEGDQ